MSFLGDLFSSPKKQTQQITVQPAPPTAAQTASQDLALEIMQLQKKEFFQASEDRKLYEASPLFAVQQANQLKANQLLQARLTGTAPVLSPEEQSRLDQIYGVAQSRGEEDLQRYANEIAGARGMTTADSPIFNEALRQRRMFGESLAAQKAASSFDLGNAATAFAERQATFGDSLKQQAFLNRMAMASLNPAAAQFASNLNAARIGMAGRTATGNLFGPQTAALLGGTGNVLSGIGQMGRGWGGGQTTGTSGGGLWSWLGGSGGGGGASDVYTGLGGGALGTAF